MLLAHESPLTVCRKTLVISPKLSGKDRASSVAPGFNATPPVHPDFISCASTRTPETSLVICPIVTRKSNCKVNSRKMFSRPIKSVYFHASDHIITAGSQWCVRRETNRGRSEHDV